jgi:hypothetical protein
MAAIRELSQRGGCGGFTRRSHREAVRIFQAVQNILTRMCPALSGEVAAFAGVTLTLPLALPHPSSQDG